MLTIKWLRLAIQDMHCIAEYMAKQDKHMAHDMVNSIWQAGMSLAEFPSRGRAGRVPDTRELVLVKYPYFIVYRVRDAKVQILRIIHTSQQYGE